MIRATIARGDGSLPGDHYRCQRCGHEAKFSVTRGRPELCRDCKELAAMEAARCEPGGERVPLHLV